ncbi:MAG: hypothetical protein JEZ09_13625 [Salinivirgaceae bacterium]|nr:hypothetical protein [Salinivirgaceae bacterium]
MKKITIILSLLLTTIIVTAQGKEDKFKDKFDDVFEEEDNNNLTLRFFNALDGEPIHDATITIGELDEYLTDAEGKARFPVPEEDGVLLVHFECAKFISSDFKIEVLAGTLFFNRFSVSPVLDLKDIRIILDWEASPKDLDAHFIKQNGYHISYRHTQILSDGSGKLDRDDMDGYGPETITIRDVDDLATYEYMIHDYSNKSDGGSSALSKSKATVKVYGQGRLLYLFQVPQQSRGTKWSVFKITEGQFVEINQIY